MRASSTDTVFRTLLAALASSVFLFPCAAQDPPKQDTEEQLAEQLEKLQQRMKQRYADLEKLRDAGKAGETFEGRVEVVEARFADERLDPKDPKSDTISDLLAAENRDRAALYALLAKKLKMTPAVIAEQNALRNLQKAESSHRIKLKSGRWVQKKDIRKEKEKEKKGR